jgi:CRISPR/Cas system-associated exonuclease Cas4 (RecB family)
MRVIRASEIGSYLYCQRAWWYQQQGIETENQQEMAAGSGIHRQHGRSVAASGCLRYAAYALLLAALVLFAIYFLEQLV